MPTVFRKGNPGNCVNLLGRTSLVLMQIARSEQKDQGVDVGPENASNFRKLKADSTPRISARSSAEKKSLRAHASFADQGERSVR